MAKFTATPAVKKQWQAMIKKEEKFIKSQTSDKESLTDRLDGKIPETLQSTLEKAFSKSFSLIFRKGVKAIEFTYNKDKHKKNFSENAKAESEKSCSATVGAYGKKAGITRSKNLAISGIEGIGLGIIGVGIPDIPVFTAMILKSVYETALNYGYSYETDEERMFILQLIRGAMTHGDDFIKINSDIDQWIHWRKPFREKSLDDLIEKASDSMSFELLATKFLQGMFLVGAVGGAYDVIYLNRITKYAELKYKRRFLFCRLNLKESAESDIK